MKNSRSLADLIQPARVRAERFLQAANDNGIDLLVTSTLRDHAAQAELYAQGRTKPGKIVTNAKPGQSWHNWGCALDVVPMRAGKPVWGTTGADLELWQRVGELGEAAGLEWAGRWRRFREFPHFQYTGGLTLADLQAGRKIA